MVSCQLPAATMNDTMPYLPLDPNQLNQLFALGMFACFLIMFVLVVVAGLVDFCCPGKARRRTRCGRKKGSYGTKLPKCSRPLLPTHAREDYEEI